MSDRELLLIIYGAIKAEFNTTKNDGWKQLLEMLADHLFRKGILSLLMDQYSVLRRHSETLRLIDIVIRNRMRKVERWTEWIDTHGQSFMDRIDKDIENTWDPGCGWNNRFAHAHWLRDKLKEAFERIKELEKETTVI